MSSNPAEFSKKVQSKLADLLKKLQTMRESLSDEVKKANETYDSLAVPSSSGGKRRRTRSKSKSRSKPRRRTGRKVASGRKRSATKKAKRSMTRSRKH